MKKIVALLIAYIFWNSLLAQMKVSQTIDSLNLELQNSREDTNKVILLNQLVEAYRKAEPEVGQQKSLQCEELALKLSTKLNYKRGLGNIFLNKGKYEISASNKYADATSDLLEALYYFEKINDSSGISKSYLQLGVVSFVLLNYDDAILNLEQCIKFSNANQSIRATAIYLIALSYSELNHTNEAKKYFARALHEYSNLGSNRGIRECYLYLGKMYVNADELDSGFFYLQKSLGMLEPNGDSVLLGRPYAFLSTAYLKKNNIEEAIRYASLSYNIGIRNNDEITILESVTTLSKGYSIKKDFSNAYFYLRELKEMKDSIFNISVAQHVAESKSKFIFEKELNDRKMKQEKEEAVTQEQIQKQKILKYAYMVGLVLLAILLLVLLNRSRLKQKSARQLTEAYDNLKATQQQLVQQEKLASLGALTAGIAHEIKNPLNFVNNFSDLSIDLINEIETLKTEEERKEVLSDLKTNLAKIAEHGKRADSIVKSMLQHSRSGLGEKQMTDLNNLCNEFIDLSFHGMRAKISDFKSDILKSFAENLPKVSIIPQDFSRVILNLCSNAFYAVKKRADSIEPDSQKTYRPQVSISTMIKDENVEVIIRDNGIGIPAGIQEKIFEPFFTTKPTGEGTGLGLSICYDIIKAHGGEIKVESKENQFTEFVITLPVKELF